MNVNIDSVTRNHVHKMLLFYLYRHKDADKRFVLYVVEIVIRILRFEIKVSVINT